MGFPLLHLRVSDLLTSRTDIQLSEVPGPQKGINFPSRNVNRGASIVSLWHPNMWFWVLQQNTIDFERQSLSEKKRIFHMPLCSFLTTEKQIRWTQVWAAQFLQSNKDNMFSSPQDMRLAVHRKDPEEVTRPGHPRSDTQWVPITVYPLNLRGFPCLIPLAFWAKFLLTEVWIQAVRKSDR